MWNKTEESHQVLAEISKGFVSEIAPEELELVDQLLDEYHTNPPRPSSSDDPLGFGEGVMVAATPVIAMVLEVVFKFLLDEVISSAKKESASFIAQKIKSIFNPSQDNKDQHLNLNPEQLKKIKELTKSEARRGGMNPKKADDFALKVVARLSLPS